MDLHEAIADIPAAERAAFLSSGLDGELAVCRLRTIRGWQPRDYQMKLWDFLQHGGKRAIAIWHRRSGKDSVALNWAAEYLLQHRCEIWHMLPEQSQARKAVWDAIDDATGRRLIDQAFPEEIRSRTRDNEMSIHLTYGV
jgi:phage terminase large subunit